ncbi:MAG: hypothetical protein U5K71_14345 [Gracilimonas sp.]|nr:hypothetical protein [Gracilimonas sp.]
MYNIRNSSPVELMDYISAIEKKPRTAKGAKEFYGNAAWDVPRTEADVTDFGGKTVGYRLQIVGFRRELMLLLVVQKFYSN